jgi:hypothetical protein
MGSLIGPIHDVLVGPFEIERIDEGFAQSLIFEFGSSRVEEPALGAGGRIIGDDFALDEPRAYRRELVPRCPGAGGEFLAEQIAFGGEPFEGNFAIAIILITQSIKVVLPAYGRQVCAPPVLYSLIFDIAARLETADFVRAAAERYFELVSSNRWVR